MLTTSRPDALDDVSAAGFIRLYETLTGYDFSTAKRMTRKDFAVVCPLHNDTHASMSFDPDGRQWFCHVCRIGGGVADMVIAFKPTTFRASGHSRKEQRVAAFRWLRAQGFARLDPIEEASALRHGGAEDRGAPQLRRVELKAIPNPKSTSKSGHVKLTNTTKSVYRYTDALGNVEYEVVRIDGLNAENAPDKIIYKRTPLPAGGRWVEGTTTWMYVLGENTVISTLPLYDNGRRRRKPVGAHRPGLDEGAARRLLYLPDVLATAASGGLIVVVEGEKKCRTLRERTGLCVTTWADGAMADLQIAWLHDVAGARRMWVLGDSDPYKADRNGILRSPGRDAARERAEFFRRVVFDVRCIDLFPDRADKSDVDDWLDERMNATRAELIAELEAIAAATEAIE